MAIPGVSTVFVGFLGTPKHCCFFFSLWDIPSSSTGLQIDLDLLYAITSVKKSCLFLDLWVIYNYWGNISTIRSFKFISSPVILENPSDLRHPTGKGAWRNHSQKLNKNNVLKRRCIFLISNRGIRNKLGFWLHIRKLN